MKVLTAIYLALVATIVAMAIMLQGCSSTGSVVRTSLNVSAGLANSAAPRALEAQCKAELQALHHIGQYMNGRCERLDNAQVATAAELAELARVRAQWAPVRRAYEAFAIAHDAARVVADAPSLQRVVEAYAALRQAALGVGLTLPGVQ